MLHLTLVQKALNYPLVVLEHTAAINQPVDQTTGLVKVEAAVEPHMGLNLEQVVLPMELQEHLDPHMEQVEPLMAKEIHMAHHRELVVEAELELVQVMPNQDHHILEPMELLEPQEQELQELEQHHPQHPDTHYLDQVLEVMDHQEQPDIMEETEND